MWAVPVSFAAHSGWAPSRFGLVSGVVKGRQAEGTHCPSGVIGLEKVNMRGREQIKSSDKTFWHQVYALAR